MPRKILCGKRRELRFLRRTSGTAVSSYERKFSDKEMSSVTVVKSQLPLYISTESRRYPLRQSHADARVSAAAQRKNCYEYAQHT